MHEGLLPVSILRTTQLRAPPVLLPRNVPCTPPSTHTSKGPILQTTRMRPQASSEIDLQPPPPTLGRVCIGRSTASNLQVPTPQHRSAAPSQRPPCSQGYVSEPF